MRNKFTGSFSSFQKSTEDNPLQGARKCKKKLTKTYIKQLLHMRVAERNLTIVKSLVLEDTQQSNQDYL